MLACQNQVRAVDGGAYAWDFPAVLGYAALVGADLRLVAELLPEIEPLVLYAHTPEASS